MRCISQYSRHIRDFLTVLDSLLPSFCKNSLACILRPRTLFTRPHGVYTASVETISENMTRDCDAMRMCAHRGEASTYVFPVVFQHCEYDGYVPECRRVVHPPLLVCQFRKNLPHGLSVTYIDSTAAPE
jgi:hypothetical protein